MIFTYHIHQIMHIHRYIITKLKTIYLNIVNIPYYPALPPLISPPSPEVTMISFQRFLCTCIHMGIQIETQSLVLFM